MTLDFQTTDIDKDTDIILIDDFDEDPHDTSEQASLDSLGILIDPLGFDPSIV